MSDWMTAAELAGLDLPNFPASPQGVNKRAATESWPRRRRQGDASHAWEYRVAAILISLPDDESRDMVRHHHAHQIAATLPLPPRAISASSPPQPVVKALPAGLIGDTTHLTNSQRATMDARAAILAYVDRLIPTAGGITQARQQVERQAKGGKLPPEIARLLPLGTAMVVNHWIGQRQGDILAMQRIGYRSGVFHVKQGKTDQRVAVPHSPWVQRRVDAEVRAQQDRKIEGTPTAPLILCESTGAAWKEDHFRHIFAEIREAAAAEWGTFFLADGSSVDMLDLQFMHLRHTAVTELAIAGCTTLQIAGITGHTPKSIDQILTRYLVRTSALAAAGTAKRLERGDNDIAALVVVEDMADQGENGSKEHAKND